jgi:hypothetical protein
MMYCFGMSPYFRTLGILTMIVTHTIWCGVADTSFAVDCSFFIWYNI